MPQREAALADLRQRELRASVVLNLVKFAVKGGLYVSRLATLVNDERGLCVGLRHDTLAYDD